MTTPTATAIVRLPHTIPKLWESARTLLLTPKFTEMSTFASALKAFRLASNGLPAAPSSPEELKRSVHALEMAITTLSRSRAWNVDFFGEILPYIQALALLLPNFFPPETTPLPVLVPKVSGVLVLPRPAIASLLACAFLSLFPEDRTGNAQLDMPGISFEVILSSRRTSPHVACILHYFNRTRRTPPKGVVSFERCTLRPVRTFTDWKRSSTTLGGVTILAGGSIERSEGTLEADFANMYIGGGVLMGGHVQEEIRFAIAPELIASMIFTPRMEDDEAVVITGTEIFSTHSGYGGTFQWADNFQDPEVDPSSGQPSRQVVAFDALYLRGDESEQFKSNKILRELNKALVAFLPSKTRPDRRPIATGNWGCGAFGGSKPVKAVIQWLASSESGIAMQYYIFGDRNIEQEFGKFLQDIHQGGERRKKPVTVGEVAAILEKNQFKDEEGFLDWIVKELFRSTKF